MALSNNQESPNGQAVVVQSQPSSPSTSTSTHTATAGGLSLRNLPTELRLVIYHHVWEPRNVFVVSVGATGPVIRPPPPLTLHLDYESRQETLKHYYRYNLYSKFINHTTGFRGEKCRHGYFNPSLDTLYLCDWTPTITRIEFPTLPVEQPLLYVALGCDVRLGAASRILYKQSGLKSLIYQVVVEKPGPVAGYEPITL